MIADDVVIPLPAEMEAELAIPLDQAIDAACERLGLPLIGGPSGAGWSMYSTAMTCPHLFAQTYGRDMDGDGRERTKPAKELQIGGLYHALQALYYGYGLGDGDARYYKRGLLSPRESGGIEGTDHLRRAIGMPTMLERLRIPEAAADWLLAYLKAQGEGLIIPDAAVAALRDGGTLDEFQALCAQPDSILNTQSKPALSLILEAERVFDAHTNHYGNGMEDVEPLAIEWFAKHPILNYTCRYDAIMRLGPHDPFVQSGQLEPGSVCVFERKTGAWLSEWTLEGWFLDGEILGQLLNWAPSGCERLFGPLAGLIVDVVTKEKTPKFTRVLVSKNPVTVGAHERGIRWQNAEIATWRAMDWWPKRWISCFRFGRKCGLYEQCRADTASEEMEGV